SARDRRQVNPTVFSESLALQLSVRHPAYAKALAEKSGDGHVRIDVAMNVGDVRDSRVIGVVIDHLEARTLVPEDAFNRLVREPLEVLARHATQDVVILVDGVDEALAYGGDVGIVSLIAQASELPKGIRFLLTSRPDAAIDDDLGTMARVSLSLSSSV